MDAGLLPTDTRTVHRTCSLCEACCGLRFEVEGDRITSVRPDHDDVLSQGFVCPKGVAIADIHHDPDRIRQPLVRGADGVLRPATWDDAFAAAARGLDQVRKAHGRDAVAVYMGNPIVHNHGAILMRSGLLAALGTRNSTSAGSQDTSPRFAASYYLYGSSLAVPIPDVDRTHYFLCFGANPVVSNGSFLSAPNMKGRLRAIQARGGRVVIVDPRRTESAREADEHVAIRPGSDAMLMLAMIQVLAAHGRIDRTAVDEIAAGLDRIAAIIAGFTPAAVAPHVGIPAATITRVALKFADAPSAVAYSRVGVCNNAFGTLATYATDLLNLAAGRLGAEGGALFTTPAFDICELSRRLGGDGHGRWHSRVRGLPETLGDLPAAILAEEMETPGEGQVRALLTFAGNPVLSTPNGRRLDAALAELDFMVSIDLYLNETTRHADVILPPAWGLTEDHVDLTFANYMVRNVARWSPAVIPRRPDERADWQILFELTKRLGGGPTGNRWFDRMFGVARWFGWRWHPDTIAEMALRTGPYGDNFLPGARGLNRKKLEAATHGIDLGPLETGLARRVFHPDGKVHVADGPFVAALEALAATLPAAPARDELLLIGRRELRTNNSWMHNVPAMVAGRDRCVLLVHPDDASRAGVAHGEIAILESRVHTGPLRVHVSDEMRPGVVSLPHGWGHAASAPWQHVAGTHPGVSANDWTDDQEVEAIVGQSILNGVPVRLRARRSDGVPATAA